MNLLLILVFAFAAVVNYFDTKVALWITLAGLIIPLAFGLAGR